MEALDLKEADLARRINVDQRKLNMVIRRDSKSSRFAAVAAPILGIPLQWFYDPDDAPYPAAARSEQPGRGANMIERLATEMNLDHEQESRDLLHAYWTIPADKRMEFKQQLVAEALRWMPRVPDAKLGHLAAPGSDIHRARSKSKAGTQ